MITAKVQKNLRDAKEYFRAHLGLRIPINSDTCSNPFRTVFRDIRTVVGAKRRSASTFRRVSELSQAFPPTKSVFGA
jgi:hypothetical protein